MGTATSAVTATVTSTASATATRRGDTPRSPPGRVQPRMTPWRVAMGRGRWHPERGTRHSRPVWGLGNALDTRVGHSAGGNVALGGICGTGGHVRHPDGDTGHRGGWHSTEEDTAPRGTRNWGDTRGTGGKGTWHRGGHGTLGTQRWHPDRGHSTRGGHTALGGPRWQQRPHPGHRALSPPALQRPVGCPGGSQAAPSPSAVGRMSGRDPPISRCFRPVPAIEALGAPGDPQVSTPGGSPAWGSDPPPSRGAPCEGGGSPQLWGGRVPQ